MKRDKLIEKIENIAKVAKVNLHPYAIQLIADLIEEIVEGIRGATRDRRKEMTDKEKILIADMLDLASEEFSNHGCNDIDEELFAAWTEKEKQNAAKEYHKYNGDPEEYEKGETIDSMGDSIIMGWLADKIRAEVTE